MFATAKRLALGSVLILAAGAPADAQNDVGRYQMAPLPALPGSYANRVMIIDTRDGHLWQWWETPAVGSGSPSSGITYLGKVTPGNSTGEAASGRRGAPPEPAQKPGRQ
jgi:hypothetical protein